jgi:hypothetical protein
MTEDSLLVIACKQGNESSGFIVEWKFLDQLIEYRQLNKNNTRHLDG